MAIDIAMVRVGNRGNRADRNGYGRVDGDYAIGKYEVTTSQYSAFLNAVAASDPYRLYNAGLMGNALNGGILRSGTDGAYTYAPISGTEAFPVTGVSWFDAARFVNWLANGQPVGPCNAQSTEDGTYALHGRVSGASAARNSLNPNTGQAPSFAIPSEDEWYKAAYYSPRLRGGLGGYYTYATQTQRAPGNQIGNSRHQVNYILDRNGFYAVTQEPFVDTQQNYLTAVGSFSASPSHYGTFDQNGNVWELLSNRDVSQPYVPSRGGGWTSLASLLQSSYRIGVSTDAEAVNAGFRVVAPPPPGAPAQQPLSEPIRRHHAPLSEPFASLLQRIRRPTAAVQVALSRVGDPGNSADPLTGFGAVAYSFQIGSKEITIAQYTAFLNAVAKRDPHRLFDGAMQSDLNIAGIRRRGREGTYSYSVIANDGNSGERPITYVSWFDAARFANWMANGQPIGPQSRFTTEDGAYALHGGDGKAPARNAINPNTGAPPSFFLPSENEWYKAAYYSPLLNNNSGGYHLYPTQSNTAPSNAISTGGSNEANLANNFVFYTTQSKVYDPISNYLSAAGNFAASPSFYGTYDQAGSVYEWNDLNGALASERGLRGGYWFSGGQSAMATTFSIASPEREASDAGFRLAASETALAGAALL